MSITIFTFLRAVSFIIALKFSNFLDLAANDSRSSVNSSLSLNTNSNLSANDEINFINGMFDSFDKNERILILWW